MQFLVIAYDGTDEKALSRRLGVRDAHLSMGKELYDQGKWLYAAGILSETGILIGSMIVCDFPSREEMENQWLSREPYISGGVWEKITIHHARIPPFCSGLKNEHPASDQNRETS